MIEPFLKWAGGKRWFVHNYSHLLPTKYKRYIEPFLGSGAVFFHLLPPKAILADVNSELINAYQQIKVVPNVIEKRLHRYQALHNSEFYYMLRDKITDDPIERAIRFIYLNRTCWNGLYRVNLKGEFNVPMGTKTLIEFPAKYLQTVSEYLKKATLLVSDFEPIIEAARDGDFVYIDPPYTVAHNTNNFIKYNAKLFSWEDQVRLCCAVKRAALRGVFIAISNANHESIKSLYAGFGQHHCVERVSVLSGKPDHRMRTTELIIISGNHRKSQSGK